MNDRGREAMSDPITAIRTRLAGPIEHSHSDHQRAIEDCRTLLTAYDGRRECDGLREALRWALENGAHYFNGTLFTETDKEPPAHLAPILAEAMRSKP